MKKVLVVIIYYALALWTIVYAQGIDPFLPDDSIYTKEQEQVINTNDIKDPLRQGAGEIIEGTDGQNKLEWDFIRPNDPNPSFEKGFADTLKLIKTIINYILGFTAFIALVFLIYNGILALFAKEDEAIKKAWDGLKTAATAIAGIALSWFVVSAIFRIISLITG